MSTRFLPSCLALSLPIPTRLPGHCCDHDHRGIPRWNKGRVSYVSSEQRSLQLSPSAYPYCPRFSCRPSIPTAVPNSTGYIVPRAPLDRNIQARSRKIQKGRATTIRIGKKRAEREGRGLLKETVDKICKRFLNSALNHGESTERRSLLMLLSSLLVFPRRINQKTLVLLMLRIFCENGQLLVSGDYCTLIQLLVFANGFWRWRRSRPLPTKVFGLTFRIHPLLKQLIKLAAVVTLAGLLMFYHPRLI